MRKKTYLRDNPLKMTPKYEGFCVPLGIIYHQICRERKYLTCSGCVYIFYTYYYILPYKTGLMGQRMRGRIIVGIFRKGKGRNGVGVV